MTKKVLVVAEKPNQAKEYTIALSKVEGGTFKKYEGYYENNRYIITYGVGHVLTSKQPKEYAEFGGWNWESIPFVPPKNSDELDYIPIERTKQQLAAVKKQFQRKDIEYVVNAADAEREGELIFWEMYHYAKSNFPVKRLMISTLVTADIIEGFKDLKEEDFYLNRKEEAYARQYADWLLGPNMTVAMTIKASMGRTLHVGRVQTPTLAILVQRYLEIENFVPKKYYEIEAEFGGKYKGMWFKKKLSETRFETKEEAEAVVNKIKGKTGKVVKKDVNETKESPKTLFNLNDLMQIGNRKFSYNGDKTLAIAQLLYEKYKILSYPRSDSRHLANVQVKELEPTLNALKIPAYEDFVTHILHEGIKVTKQFVDDKKVSDHHAIIPTKTKPNINQFVSETVGEGKNKITVTVQDLKNIHDVVVRRFLAVFYPSAIYEKTEIVTEVENETFKTSGKILVDPGWKVVYGKDVDEEEDTKKGGKEKDKTLPPIDKDEENETSQTKLLDKETKPRPHYTEADLYGIMEDVKRMGIEEEELLEKLSETKASLGTSATRANIVKGIINRGYAEMKGKALIPTKLGIDLIEVAPDDFKTPEITANWEEKMIDIKEGKVTRKEFQRDIREYVTNTILSLKNKTLEVKFENVNEGKTIGECPTCHTPIKEKKTVYGCGTQQCFIIGKTVGGKSITESHINALLTKQETPVIKGIKKKDSKDKFDAKLILKDGKIQFAFPSPTETGMKCPKCGGRVFEGDKGYFCEFANKSCFVKVSKKILEKTITKKQVETLMKDSITGVIEGFKGAKGPFSAKLKIDDAEKRINFSFEGITKETKKSTLECPFCKKGKITENDKAFGCSNWQECKGFTLWKRGSKKLSFKSVEKLIADGETEVINDFVKNDNGKQAYSGYYEWNKSSNKIEFKFPKK